MMTLEIPYPETPEGRKAWAKEYSLNAYWSGKHYQQRRKDADYWHQLTLVALLRAERVERFTEPVIITFYWDDNLDIDNHAAIAKMIVDALKKRVIKDDNKKHFIGVEHYFNAGTGKILVKIRKGNEK